MQPTQYRQFQNKIVLITLAISLLPLILLGTIIYVQFSRMVQSNVETQISYRARAQAETVDLFLKERTAILASMADTHSFEEITRQEKLTHILKVMNLRAGAFVDIGVIDRNGQHRAYVGPFDLRDANYSEQTWFAEVISKGIYISDVFTGFRQLPHFIIAIRRQEQQELWIVRATIDPDEFGNLVRAAQVGKTGDAFIINRAGLYQTIPRFGKGILTQSGIDPSQFGGRTTIVAQRDASGNLLLSAGSWLKNTPWLILIRQGLTEEMEELFATRNMEIVIIIVGILTIVMTTILTARITVGKLEQADQRMSRLNAQLMQSDKLAALGKMAAGVGHEINNPLTIIAQKTGWLQDLIEEEQEIRNNPNFKEFQTSLLKIDEQVERARKVVLQMLGYARKMEPHLEELDINEILNQSITFLENYAKINNITFAKRYTTNLPPISAEPSKIQQVFMNLISNAIDAIGKNGVITLTTTQEGFTLLVTVQDTGPGIPEAKLKMVFDPFFTTKEIGKGTGLGLWVCYNIIERMGGTISVSSKQGEGTTFAVSLPASLPGMTDEK